MLNMLNKTESALSLLAVSISVKLISIVIRKATKVEVTREYFLTPYREFESS
jgi:hypothetical protein